MFVGLGVVILIRVVVVEFMFECVVVILRWDCYYDGIVVVIVKYDGDMVGGLWGVSCRLKNRCLMVLKKGGCVKWWVVYNISSEIWVFFFCLLGDGMDVIF